MRGKKTTQKEVAEVDFSKGVRGLHHVPASARVYMPVSIERACGNIFPQRGEQRCGTFVACSEVLKRDIETKEKRK